MVAPKDCHEMTTYYLGAYHDKYKRSPIVNRHKARWGFDSVLMDMSKSEAKELIDYYLSCSSTNGHSLEWFFYNYERLIEKRADYEKDQVERARLREESRRRVEEFNNRDNTSG